MVEFPARVTGGLEFYGPEAATLIRTAPKVEILRSPPDDNLDLSHVPGLLNARTSLLSDASYDWVAPTTPIESPLFSSLCQRRPRRRRYF